MKTNAIRKSIHFIQFLNSNRKTLFQAFNRSEELLSIMRTNKIASYFQPIVSMHDGSTFGYEILNRPKKMESFSTTESFYNFVDESNQILAIEGFIRNIALKRFCEQARQCNKKETNLFLNIHPKVLVNPTYLDEMIDILAKCNISPRQIILEITERKAGINESELKAFVDLFRKRGLRIALDDVGSGYNTLQTLFHIRPDFIKIDKSLIRNIEDSAEKQCLAKFIHEFALESTAKVIAEGIETAAEYSFLQKLGIHMGQGYAIGKPLATLTTGKVPQE